MRKMTKTGRNTFRIIYGIIEHLPLRRIQNEDMIHRSLDARYLRRRWDEVFDTEYLRILDTRYLGIPWSRDFACLISFPEYSILYLWISALLSLLDTAYLSLFLLWSLVSAGTGNTQYLPMNGYGRMVFRIVFFNIYSVGLEVGSIRRIQGLDTAYWGFLGVGTTLDIFQNIIFIPYFQYGVLVFWIRRIELYSFVVFGECRHGYAVSSLMDTAYWSSE
ncbi:hypothetical protein Tco_0799891 [Tanacetum coccineum]|uniref:Uncharacterized protein n=1 Tax=Tanacetum coccineum TaxID=301880 RepID=A0ABQ4ZRL2_9ASTR